jgi:hypothetical protein
MNEKKDQGKKQDIEQLLAKGHTIRLHPQGYSMYPLFVPGRDEAIIAPPERTPRRGDVVLYRRDQSILVLHRICKVTKEGIYLVGDNQTEVEGPLRPDQIRGILVAFVRRGKQIKTTQPVYAAASRIWLFLLPLRDPLMRTAAGLKRRIRRGNHP